MAPLPEAKLEAIMALLGRYRPIAIYAFGSRAAGGPRPDSDLDLAVSLPAGSRLPLSERIRVVDELQGIAGCDVDLVVLSDARLPLRFEIIRHSRVLWESSFDERTDVEESIVRDYLDFYPFLERSFREILEETRPSDR